MASWSEFAAVEPALASAVHALVYQYGPGLGYLATVRVDGGPRVHPVSPVIADGGLFCFLIDSPKRRDLERDGRYALHAYPAETNDDEAYLAGRARPVVDAARKRRLAEAMRAEPRVDWRLFELTIEVAMVIRRPTIGVASSGPVPASRAPEEPPAVEGAPIGRTVWRDPALMLRRVS